MYSISEKIGNDIIRLNLNEYDFNHPPNFYSNLLEKQTVTHYTNIYNDNTVNLLNELSLHNNVNNENILLTAGSDNALEYIVNTFVNINTKVIVLYPTYNYFSVLIKNKENIKYIKNNILIEEYDIYDVLINELNNNEDMIVYIVNPNNPIGNKFNKNTMEKLLNEFNSVLFIIDEAYINFLNINESLSNLIYSNNNLIITRTFSKAYGLAGLRLGYILSNNNYINKISLIYNEKSVTDISKKAGLYVFRNIIYYENIINEVIELRNIFQSFLKDNNIFYIKSNANFVCIYVGNNIDLIIGELKNNNIIVRNKNNDIKGFMRITIGNFNNMNILMGVLYKMLHLFDNFNNITR